VSKTILKGVLPVPTSKEELAFAHLMKEKFSWTELARMYGVTKERMRYLLQSEEERAKHNDRQRERWRANAQRLNEERKARAREVYGMSYSKLQRLKKGTKHVPGCLPPRLPERIDDK
jgi:Fe-S cluster assembly scaffold protein SufB